MPCGCLRTDFELDVSARDDAGADGQRFGLLPAAYGGAVGDWGGAYPQVRSHLRGFTACIG